jgi:mono/diheme cytochrome c family protein
MCGFSFRMGMRLVITVLLATMLAACGSDPAEQPAGAASSVVAVDAELLGQGRIAYRKYCVQCHGYSGKGDGTSAAHLTPPPRDHTDAELMDPISDQVIAETVRFGGTSRGYPNMPAFPQVTSDELVALVAYVRSLSRPEVDTVDLGGIDE